MENNSIKPIIQEEFYGKFNVPDNIDEIISVKNVEIFDPKLVQKRISSLGNGKDVMMNRDILNVFKKFVDNSL